jgi:SpoIIAA-like
MIAGAGLAQVYLDTPYVSVSWARHCVMVEWKAWAGSADFRAAQLMSIRACEENRSSQLLVDARNMKVVLVDDERWWAEEMLPLLAMTGVRWVAVVKPTNRLAGAIVSDVGRTRRNLVAETRHFETLDEARQWLSVMEIRQLASATS